MIISVGDLGFSESVAAQWDQLTGDFSSSPFLLRKYIAYTAGSRNSTNRQPTFVLLMEGAGRLVVGAAPFILGKKHGIHFAKSFYGPAFTSDFALDPRYRKEFNGGLLGYLLRNLHCNIVEITLPAESASVLSLQEECRRLGLHWWELPVEGHSVVPVSSDWESFERSRGSNFRNFFRKTERKIANAGRWRIVRMGLESAEAGTMIAAVERNSWKEADRKRLGKPTLDRSVGAALELSKPGGPPVPGYCGRVWVLEVDSRPVSYALFLLYKDTAFAMKTSYDLRFRRLYPGTFVFNAAIRDTFEEKAQARIDFMTALDWHRRWAPAVQGRARLLISASSVLTDWIDLLRRAPGMRRRSDSLALAWITNF